jgi:NAD(P)-dependent dehydrogenase (short-subunit alcohol dehydrogenase family)
MSTVQSRVLILGGTSGLGLATAALLASHDFEVVIASSRQSSVDRALATLPDTVSGYSLDLRDEAALGRLFEDIGDIDHLIYTAAEPLVMMNLEELDIQAARDFFGLRFFGALAAVKAATPHIRQGGSITLTSGSAAERPGTGWSVPASICGAINSLTKSLAVELSPIRVNAVAPGAVRSPIWANLSDDERAGLYDSVAASNLVGAVGEVEDIAAAFAFLVSQPYASGTIVNVDGGALLV